MFFINTLNQMINFTTVQIVKKQYIDTISKHNKKLFGFKYHYYNSEKLMKKRSLGIIRNKLEFFRDQRNKIHKKKSRFVCVPRQSEDNLSDSSENPSQRLTTQTSINSFGQQSTQSREIYKQARKKLRSVRQLQKNITSQSKARLVSFKQSENQKYDEKISRLAGEATQGLVHAEKLLKKLDVIEPKNQAEGKFISNMQFSLAQEIRDLSRELRNQEKEYFDRIRTYEKNIVNRAIQLSDEEKKNMRGGFFEEEEMQEQINDMKNDKIDQLVRSINKLTTIYKELNNLVIEQGSIIDRIDVNIDATYQHTQKAVKHLQGANQQAGNSFSDNCIKIMLLAIIILSVILGYKFSKSS